MEQTKPLLLAIDAGNTNITIGVYEGQTLLKAFRLSTDVHRTADDYGIMLRVLLDKFRKNTYSWEGAVICSVVKNLADVLQLACIQHLDIPALVIHYRLKTGLRVLTDNPEETGADRIVNAAAAYSIYGGPVVVVDLGTATTFDVVSSKGEFLGGAIVPGLRVMADSLSTRTSLLPRIEIKMPQKAIGRNTVTAIQSGIFLGYIDMIIGMIHRIELELGQKPIVVLTGGYAGLFEEKNEIFRIIEPNLTLMGCKIIFDMNSDSLQQKK